MEKSLRKRQQPLNNQWTKAALIMLIGSKPIAKGPIYDCSSHFLKKIRKKILVADFEPGIIDAYEGEDKLHHLMAYMDKEPFWVSSMEIKGAKRILSSDLQGDAKKQIISNQKISPCWCEISYINDMKSSNLGFRENLLAWVFATILEQHGFALGIARKGTSSGEAIFANFTNPLSQNYLDPSFLLSFRP